MRKKLFFLAALLFSMQFAIAQSVDVSGKITDDKGAPIPSASVMEKGTRNGTVTANDGSFALKVKQGAKLIISALGYETKEVTASGKVTVELAQDTRSLSEVVVTGVGVATSKKKIAFATETVTADKLPAAPTADVGNALVGKIPGAQISSVGGSPGAPVNILLRGINSIRGGTRPMILVDGIQVAATGLESLDLNSVERIEVIQGPAAGTIYGAQGANGVIQLFTKRGKQGKLNIDISSSAAINELLNIGGVQKSRFHSFNTNANGEVVNSSGAVIQFDPVTGSYLDNPVFNLISPTSIANKEYNKNLKFYDHYKMFFQQASIYNNSININGARDKFDFGFIVSDNRQGTVFKDNGNYSRTNMTANIGVELFKGLKFRTTTQLVNTVSTLLDADGRNMFYAINNARPFANFEQKDAAGLYSPYFGDAVGVNHYNFKYIQENADYKEKTIDIIQNFNLNYKFPRFVEIDAKYGLNRSGLNRRYEIFDQSGSEGAEYWQYQAEYYSPRTSFGAPSTNTETGEINQRDVVEVFQNFNANAYIRFDFEKDFKIKLPITSSTQVGWDYRKSSVTDFWSYGTDAPDFTPYNSTNMANFKIATDSRTDFATYGYLVNQRFDYGEFGGFSAGFRSDYSSAFGRGSKPFTFPRGDAYLRVSSFDFWQNQKISSVITEWKLRAAYGEAGIQPGAYDRFPVLTATTVGTQSALSTPVTNANPDLQVEVAKELEIGTDFLFKAGKNEWFKNIGLSFTYWDRTSENVIDQVDVAPSLGIGRQLTNSMTLKSNGIQASVNLGVYTDKTWNWNFTTNFSKQKSIVSEIAGGAEILKLSAAGSSQYVIKAGEQIGQIYGYLFLNRVDQRDPNGNFYIAEALQKNYEVASNGYVVNTATKQPFATSRRYTLGDPNPDFNISFINDLNYKGYVNLSFQIDWVQGSNLYNQTKEWMYRDGIHKDYAVPVTIGGQTEAWTAFYRGAYAVVAANGTKSYFMEDASFVRLRNIALSFDAAKLFSIKGVNRLQLVLSGRNLVTLTKYTGMDPEVSSGTSNSSWDRGVDHNTIPNIKSYQVGLNIGF